MESGGPRLVVLHGVDGCMEGCVDGRVDARMDRQALDSTAALRPQHVTDLAQQPAVSETKHRRVHEVVMARMGYLSQPVSMIDPGLDSTRMHACANTSAGPLHGLRMCVLMRMRAFTRACVHACLCSCVQARMHAQGSCHVHGHSCLPPRAREFLHRQRSRSPISQTQPLVVFCAC
eukprot:222385-Chlamydomonas_euryale.AAC.1